MEDADGKCRIIDKSKVRDFRPAETDNIKYDISELVNSTKNLRVPSDADAKAKATPRIRIEAPSPQRAPAQRQQGSGGGRLAKQHDRLASGARGRQSPVSSRAVPGSQGAKKASLPQPPRGDFKPDINRNVQSNVKPVPRRKV